MAQRETQTKKRAQKQKRAKSKRETLKAAAKRKGLLGEFEKLLALQDAKVRALAKTTGTVWNNQVSLDEAINRVEEEFCVLGRLIIPKVNEILIASGSEDLITEEAINSVFAVWHEFKKRSDFKAHFVPWFMGVPLEDLPPPPITELVEEENIAAPAPEEGEGAIEFGGDYGEGQTADRGDETTEEGQSEGDASSAPDAVPEGQDLDGSVRGTEQEEGTEMSQVPDGV